LAGVLRTAHEIARRIIRADAIETGIKLDPATQMPSGLTGKIILREPSADLKQEGFMSVENLFAGLNKALEENDLRVWVLLDRLDVAFVENHELEANALRALIRACSEKGCCIPRAPR
jgi:hypothetical protein